jgi:large subunit ribosomal protein LP0
VKEYLANPDAFAAAVPVAEVESVVVTAKEDEKPEEKEEESDDDMVSISTFFSLNTLY